MREGRRQEERAPEAVERFVKQLLVAQKAAKLYPAASDIPQESANDLLGLFRELLREQPELRLQVTKDGFLYAAFPVLPGIRPIEHFAREFYNRNIAEVRFHTGATPREVIDFLRLMQESPDVIAVTGGFEQRLWDLQIDNITVRAATTKIVDQAAMPAAETPASAEGWPPPHEQIDELIEAAYGARPRDQRMLVRFTQSPRLVSRYLQELAAGGKGGRSLANLIGGRVVALAHAAASEFAEDQPALFRSLAESLMSLDPETRRSVLIERLLPDSRMDDAVAEIMRQFELGELCAALVQGMGEDPVSRDGLSRAIRNLAAISMHPKEEVFEAAAGAMRQAGLDEGTLTAVLEGATPARLTMRPGRETRNESIENVIRLVDLAPVAQETEDADFAGLKAEVRAGVSDGDILIAVVTLATIERRADVFASLMNMVEDGLGVMLEWGEYGDASTAAAALAALDGDDSLDAVQRKRVDAALESMALPRRMGEVAAAMRVHAPGTPEHEACRQLLETLGARTISPLLEVLAGEQDMATRKSLVDTISAMAGEHIRELGDRTSDGRWYFVRNVVQILGSTRQPQALQHLNRTLRHADVRVRRETIRAAAAIKDRLAEEMLVAALADDDAQNVSLAARYLGSLSVKAAVPALAAVAEGEGRGSRDVPVRVEAIEALGRIGTPEAEAAVAEAGRHRGLLRSGRSREVQTAAEAALARIEQRREVRNDG